MSANQVTVSAVQTPTAAGVCPVLTCPSQAGAPLVRCTDRQARPLRHCSPASTPAAGPAARPDPPSKHPFRLIYVRGGPMRGCLLLAGV